MIDLTPSACRYMAKLSNHVRERNSVEGLSEEQIFTHERGKISSQILRYSEAGMTMTEYFFTNDVPPHDGEHSILSGLQYRFEDEGFDVKIGRHNNTLVISWGENIS